MAPPASPARAVPNAPLGETFLWGAEESGIYFFQVDRPSKGAVPNAPLGEMFLWGQRRVGSIFSGGQAEPKKKNSFACSGSTLVEPDQTRSYTLKHS